MDKQKKKLIKRYITWGCLALVVLILSVLPLIAGNQVEEDGPQASILTTSAEMRDLESQLIGGGQLSSEAAEAITIPEAIKITKYLVGNGDSVKKGDPIARVDKVSVMLALQEVQETLDYLAKELAAISNDTDPDKVIAQAGGLVKVIYAQKGDSVRDVMLEHGALAILSLNGRMAVDIETDREFSYGDKVNVTLASGKKISGKVESCVAGKVTVSVKDDDYEIDQTVTVSAQNGEDLGSGNLYIHSPWKATAFNGTVSKVNAKLGDSLSANKTLFELKVTGPSSEFQILNTQRQEYEEMMQDLFIMYDSGVISAPCDGFVSGVDKDGAFLLAATEEQSWYVQPLRHTTKNSDWTVVSLSAVSPDLQIRPELQDTPVIPDKGEVNPDIELAPVCTKTEDCGGLVHEPGCPKSGVTELSYSGWVGQVAEVTESGVVLKLSATAVQTSNPAGLTITGKLTQTQTYAATTYADGSPISKDDTVFLLMGNGGLIKIKGGSNTPGSQMPGGMPGGFGGMGGFGGGGGSVQTFEPYSQEELTIAYVTTQEKMALEINVDEQDIAKLQLGQEATVTVEALTGQTFPATITSIGNTGTNEGGSSKFTVELTLSKAGDMLPGMNASAFLNLKTTANVLTIPVAALVEDGTRTLVYTSYDAKAEALGTPVEVTTGVSDGEYVEILSGLSNGDTVMYAYYDTLETATFAPPGFGF